MNPSCQDNHYLDTTWQPSSYINIVLISDNNIKIVKTRFGRCLCLLTQPWLARSSTTSATPAPSNPSSDLTGYVSLNVVALHSVLGNSSHFKEMQLSQKEIQLSNKKKLWLSCDLNSLSLTLVYLLPARNNLFSNTDNIGHRITIYVPSDSSG